MGVWACGGQFWPHFTWDFQDFFWHVGKMWAVFPYFHEKPIKMWDLAQKRENVGGILANSMWDVAPHMPTPWRGITLMIKMSNWKPGQQKKMI